MTALNDTNEHSDERSRGQIEVGRVRGVSIQGHWSLPVLALIVAVGLATMHLPSVTSGYTSITHWLAALFAAVAFVGSVLAHELGHAVSAERRGLKVHGIVLWALGGAVHLTRSPNRPQDEAAIGLAGPAVGFMTAAMWWLSAAGFRSIGVAAPMVAALEWLAFVTCALSAFNLLPASPLDGGRLLRAAFWHVTGRRNSGHMAAAQLGRALGVSICLVGVWRFALGAEHGIVFALVGWLLVAAANSEAHSSDMEIALGDTHADDVLVRFGAATRCNQTPREVLDASDPLRLPPGHLVYDDDGAIAGLLLNRRLLRACNDGTLTVGDVMVPRSELLMVTPDMAVLDAMTEMECFDKQRAIVLSEGQPIGFFGVPELRTEVRRKLHRCRQQEEAIPSTTRRPARLVGRMAAAVAALAVMAVSMGIRDTGTEVVCDCQITAAETALSADGLPE